MNLCKSRRKTPRRIRELIKNLSMLVSRMKSSRLTNLREKKKTNNDTKVVKPLKRKRETEPLDESTN
jgi:hypothetical protein